MSKFCDFRNELKCFLTLQLIDSLKRKKSNDLCECNDNIYMNLTSNY